MPAVLLAPPSVILQNASFTIVKFHATSLLIKGLILKLSKCVDLLIPMEFTGFIIQSITWTKSCSYTIKY